MADWSVIRTTLGTWVNSITGLTCYWGKRPRPGHFGDAYAVLTIRAPITRGHDDVLTEYDDTQPAGSDIRQYQAGQRQFTFGVQVRSFRQSDDVDALNYTSLLRDSTDLPTKSRLAFDAADIAFARILSETALDVTLDNRECSVSQMDFLFNATALVEDTATTWIETLDDFELTDEGTTPVTTIWTGDIDVG